MWPDRRVIELFGVEHPILLAPMAEPGTAELAIAVAEAGGLGAIPCAMLQPDEIRANLSLSPPHLASHQPQFLHPQNARA